jgi:hypothetical protein
MRRIVTSAGFIALAFCTVALMAPARHSDLPAAPASPLFEGAAIDEATLTLFQRSCQNCHSENTRWPWYSRIPPGSWMIARDVREARAHVDLSRWAFYDNGQQDDFLARIGAVVHAGRMPLARYTLLHREAILTSGERRQIYEWTRAERRRLRSAETGFAPSSP